MFRCLNSLAVGLLACCCVNASAAQDPQPVPVALPTVPVAAMSARLKESLVKTLPDKLEFATGNNWGHQAQVPSLQGVKLVNVLRNHGDWQKARVVTWQLPKYLAIRVADLQSLDDSRIAFTMHLTAPATVELDHETWQNGVQIYSEHVRARFHLTADVTIESTLGPAIKGSPTGHREASFQIARATFACDDFVTENVNGLGGDVARLTGARRKFKAWQPPVLREFQESVLTAVQQAGATSDVRASLSQLGLQSATARFAALQAAAERRPLPDSAPPAAVPMSAAPMFLCGGMAIPFPFWLETAHRPAWERVIHRDHADFFERSILSAHSIHYAPAAPTGSGSAARTEPDHKK